jgi:hypothetical protein
MATKGQYLVNNTVEDCASLIQRLENARSLLWRVVNRMEAIGAPALDDVVFENDYTKTKFIALYTALNALPDFVIDDDTRDKVFDLLSSVQ